MKSRNSPLVLGFVAIVALVSSACAGVTRVAEPPYAIEFREGDLEVRKYGPRVVAETEVAGSFGDAGNEGFRRLAGYIFGKNKRRSEIAMTAPVAQASAPEPQKIAMTAPVAQRGSPSAWTVAFTMPAGETLTTLPVPDDPRVVLRELSLRYVWRSCAFRDDGPTKTWARTRCSSARGSRAMASRSQAKPR